MLEAKPKVSDLIKAVVMNNPKSVNTILHSGVNPNGTLDADEISPLHYAAQNDAYLVIPLLVEAGANVHAETEPDGYTPLDIALLHENYKSTQILMAYMKDRQMIPN